LATVGAFSVGLAIALVGVGIVAAWGVGRASRRFGRVHDLARRLPCLSSVLVLGIGVLMRVSGWSGLTL
jgi:nickel/cobalt transporter (NicO) family protein